MMSGRETAYQSLRWKNKQIDCGAAGGQRDLYEFEPIKWLHIHIACSLMDSFAIKYVLLSLFSCRTL